MGLENSRISVVYLIRHSIAKSDVSSSCPMVSHSPPHTNSVLVMYEKLLNTIVIPVCEQYPIALYMTVLQKHTTQPQSSFDQIKAPYKCNKTLPSAPHVVLDKTFIISSDSGHLLFNEVMCGMNNKPESNKRPRNLASQMTRICVPFRYKSRILILFP